jgi:diaminopimelate epimerase
MRDALPPIEPLAALLCDRHLGIGADQLLVVRPGTSADFRMEIWNADGSQVEMCANGIRAFYKYLRDHGHTDRAEIGVETLSGVVRPRWAGRGPRHGRHGAGPILAPAKIPTTLGAGDGPVLDVPLAVDGETLRVSSVSMGNPHAVIYVDDPDATPVERWGRVIEHHAAVPEPRQRRVRARAGPRPDRAAHLGARAGRDARVRERCVARSPWYPCCAERSTAGSRIELRGGVLEISWPAEDAHVEMTGPAAEVFTVRSGSRSGACSRES